MYEAHIVSTGWPSSDSQGRRSNDVSLQLPTCCLERASRPRRRAAADSLHWGHAGPGKQRQVRFPQGSKEHTAEHGEHDCGKGPWRLGEKLLNRAEGQGQDPCGPENSACSHQPDRTTPALWDIGPSTWGSPKSWRMISPHLCFSNSALMAFGLRLIVKGPLWGT